MIAKKECAELEYNSSDPNKSLSYSDDFRQSNPVDKVEWYLHPMNPRH
jgi:hypothetical protein